jgi:hypothetical protein
VEADAQKREDKMAATRQKTDSLYGKTIRWTFADGATAGKTYEHTFHADGTVDFGGVDGSGKGKTARARQAAVEKMGDDIFVASYLGDSGYTLTVVLNMEENSMIGFASNDKEWSKQTGTFSVLS